MSLLLMGFVICLDICIVIRYTQTAVASFGSIWDDECGQKPAGFTRLTPEVLDWVKKTAEIYHRGISIPGEVLYISRIHPYLLS